MRQLANRWQTAKISILTAFYHQPDERRMNHPSCYDRIRENESCIQKSGWRKAEVWELLMILVRGSREKKKK